MINLTRLTLALVLSTSAASVFADTAPLSAEAVASHAAAAATLRVPHLRAAQPAATKAAGLAAPKVMGSQTYPGSPGPNPLRAYPPSCAADPLPDKASGPTWSALVPLYATQLLANGGSQGVIENVRVTVWRLACSSSGSPLPYNPTGAANAITLMRIDRANDSNTSVIPSFPLVEVSQNNSAFGIVRAAVEPNTVISETPFDSLVYTSTTYVLENYPYQGYGYFTYSDGFTLRIDPQIDNIAAVDITVPAYHPTQNTYPDAFNPLPIDGYMGVAWYDPAHGGEGMFAQVIDNADGATRTFFAAWFTYDPLGLPFWITAQGTFDIGATTVDATGYYQTGGGFAGNFGRSTVQNTWGTLTFNFPDCATMKFSYNGRTDAQTNGPGGNGSRTWKRLADNNGLTCE